MKTLYLAVMLAFGALSSGTAWAAFPTGTMEFLEPSGTVGPDDSIDVMVRLTLDPGSPSISASFGRFELSTIPSEDLPTQGYFRTLAGALETRSFATYDPFAFFTPAIDCPQTFTALCTGAGSYTYTAGNPGVDNGFVNLEPGVPYDFAFVHLTPLPGGAQAGAYSWNQAATAITVYGKDALGNSLYRSVYVAQTCDECQFTRTVLAAVPEPESYVMMLLGALGVLAAALRNSRGK